jgi:hypothetical protein
MPAGATFDAITTTTINSTTSSITLSSIDQTYNDLLLICNFSSVNSSSYVGIRFNGDTGNNYNTQRFYSVVSVGIDANHYSLESKALIGSVTGGNRGGLWLNINHYANTATFKPMFAMDDNPHFRHGSMVGTWASTSAINEITLICPDASGFTSGSIISLYGIKAA